MINPEDPKPALRRFYSEVSVVPAPSGAGFCVVLDGRQIKTPAKNQFWIPSRPLAEAIADEWDGQEKVILPENMPLTQIGGTALDKVAPACLETRAATLDYANTDLLCYRADGPSDLVKLQSAQWQPVLNWLSSSYDAPLHCTVGIMAVEQPKESIAALAARLDSCDAFALTAFNLLTTTLGSIALAFAVREGHLTPRAAWEAAFLDEVYQAQRWGEDYEANQRRTLALADIEQAHRFLVLLR